MRHISPLVLGLIFLFATNSYCAPILFNNVMVFDNHNFALIDFEENQTSYSEINSYLSAYNANLVGGDFGGAVIQERAYYVSPTHRLHGSKGVITVRFNTPVKAAGIFLCAVAGTNGEPYDGGSGGSITVTLGNDAGTFRYNYTEILTPSGKITGFLGVIDIENGITEFEYLWNRDTSGADNLYFGNNLTTSIDLLG
ncbi:MAG: hypothetical protein RBU23_01865 [Candidatus Auribacterota bacterium]|jgi:hypothetical protein|nr:hypothetical protein [Candidatus Auribacterota bacterium]